MSASAPPGAPVVHVVVAGEVGGAERMLVSLARSPNRMDQPGSGPALAQRRHLVALWTDDAAVRALFEDAWIPVVSRPERPGPTVTPLLGATGGPDVGWLADFVRDAGAAAVHLHTFASHVLGTRAARLAGVPVVRTEHSTRVYDSWLCRPFSRWSLRRASAIVAVSEYLRRAICAREPYFAERVQVIRNGVSPGLAVPRPRVEGPLRLGIVARLEPRKGVDRALRALADVPGPSLEVVGDGPLRRQLERLASDLGIASRVRFWGYRTDPEHVLANTDAVMCSSRTEGLGVALLEAMSLGRPVVASPVGGVPEIVRHGETGWLAVDPSWESLAAALREACAAGRHEMARRGDRARVAVARDFNVAQMQRAYDRIYEGLTAPVTAATARARQRAARASSRSRA